MLLSIFTWLFLSYAPPAPPSNTVVADVLDGSGATTRAIIDQDTSIEEVADDFCSQETGYHTNWTVFRRPPSSEWPESVVITCIDGSALICYDCAQ